MFRGFGPPRNGHGNGRGGYRGGFRGGGRGGNDHNRGGGRGRGRGRGDGRRREREYPMGFRELQELQHKEDGEILQIMANPMSGFKMLLESRGHIKPDWIEIMLKVLARVCTYKGAPATLMEVLNEVRDSAFIRDQLTTFYVQIMTSPNPLKFIDAINDSTKLFDQLLQRMPNCADIIFIPYTILERAIKTADTISNSTFPTYIKEQVADIGELCQELMEKRKNVEETPSYYPKSENNPPPNDFREMPVIPTVEDVKSLEMPYLRQNLEKGAFDDLDHYLDVQFRLLREDFVRPLRSGITDYLRMVQDGVMNRKLADVRIYNGVQVLYPVCTPNGVSHRIKFDISLLKRVRWQNSKRLIYGSLLCLSRDNFETLLFAIVANRDAEHIQDGEIEVQFAHNLEELNNIPPNAIFVMAETTAYFEAYRHVLQGLKTVEQDFPFQKYLVRGLHEVGTPKYVSNIRNEEFDMSCICADLQNQKSEKVSLRDLLQDMNNDALKDRLAQMQRERKVKKVSLLNENTWPTPERLQLDYSQFEALRCALTRELAIIQGPPGTGKTYIGLKIVRCLLNNKEFWQSKEHNPILVVCYTNHALDQFLEGIYEYCKEDVVRVGGRSKSEVLKRMNLRELRRKVRLNRAIPQAIFGGRINARTEMEELERKMDRVATKIAATEKGIIHEDIIEQHIDRELFENLVAFFNNEMQADFPEEYRQYVKRPSILVEWLGLGDFLWRHEQINDRQQGNVQNRQANGRHQVYARDQQAPPNQVVDNAAEGIQQMGIDDLLEEEIEGDEEADIEERRRAIEIDDYDLDQQREARHRINEENAQRDMAFNIAALDEQQPGADDQGWQVRREDRRQRKRKLKQGLQSTDIMSREEVESVVDLWALPVLQRWRLYRYWISLYKEHMREGIRVDEQRYQQAANRLKEIMNQEDQYVMKSAKVIGMTTTGAARYRDILQELKPKIIVVEEAAEVLEAHIITTISTACEHLILIGDHKQLRPNPTVYELAEKYNLKISLFERLINNSIPHVTLSKQHRMRPQISQFMRHIYPELVDDESVYEYDAVKGVGKNVFFLSHNYEEDHDEELKSKGNHHEAKFVAEFCRYLTLQGYKNNDITVLTPYTGQVVKLKKFMPKKDFDGLRISAIDNFQGEENEIIIVSLVRSKRDTDVDSEQARKLVGFLKEANRICVTLSRAKKGMYVIGNFDLFVKSHDLWGKIITTAKENELFGDAIQLYCQNHPKDNGLIVRHSRDFKRVPEGGCMKPCEYRLPCGHVCSMVCHTLDMDHRDYRCKKPCGKTLCEKKHKCKKFCFKECGRCDYPEQKIIPQCNHLQLVPCSVPPSKFKCSADCSFILQCGHICKNKCGESHTDMCREAVQKVLPCSHKVNMKCFEDPLKYQCPEACKAQLDCEHFCKGSCGKCKQGRIHFGCVAACGRTLVCGDICEANCTKDCPPCKKMCKNRCVHSRCTKRCGQPCQKCMEPCEWKCEHYKCTKRCHEKCNRRRCNQPCKELLKCRHRCIGMCGEKCPTLCRICNRDEVEEIFFGDEDEEDAKFVQLEHCGHVFEVKGLDRWMDLAVDLSSGKLDVQLKVCPKCNVPIRSNLRYGEIINSMLNDIEKVKTMVAGEKSAIEQKQRDLKLTSRELARLDRPSYEILHKRLSEDQVTMTDLNVIENAIVITKSLYQLKNKVKERFSFEVTTQRDGCVQKILQQIEELSVWILEPRTRFSEQELNEARLDVERLQMFFNLHIIRKRIKDKGANVKQALLTLLQNAKDRFTSKQHLDENKRNHIKSLIETLDKEVPASGLGISEQERIEIVKAIGLSKGHWYKCPKGHIYAIGECGGANQGGKCPECNSAIGGASHRLADGNEHAGEMDGSGYAAWSEQANLENYGFDVIH